MVFCTPRLSVNLKFLLCCLHPLHRLSVALATPLALFARTAECSGQGRLHPPGSVVSEVFSVRCHLGFVSFGLSSEVDAGLLSFTPRWERSRRGACAWGVQSWLQRL
eukprot:893622-Amphidinium_carterae.1